MYNESSKTTGFWAFLNTKETPTTVSGYFISQEVTISVASERKLPGTSLKSLMKMREKDPARSKYLKAARLKLSEQIDKDKYPLAQLRLSKGLSQTQLADKMGMQQPSIARIERGAEDIKLSTIEKLSVALGVDKYEVFVAAELQRTGYGK